MAGGSRIFCLTELIVALLFVQIPEISLQAACDAHIADQKFFAVPCSKALFLLALSFSPSE